MFGNKVLQAITSTGTGTYQLNSTGVGAWKSWRSAFATGSEVFYFATREDGSVWEYGRGTLTYGTPDTMSRTLVTSSTGSLIDWASADGTVYVMSVPMAQAMEGRWDSGGGFFVPAMKRPYTAVGAAGKTVALSDAAGRFSLDNSAAARTVTLPAISAVPVGFNVEVFGLSQAYYLNIAPNGTNVIDYGSGGQTLPLPGKVPVLIWSDGSQWRTNFDYSAMHVMGIATPNAASSVDFTSLPYWANRLEVYGSVKLNTNNVGLSIQTYGADGVLDTGASDYYYQTWVVDNGGASSAVVSAGTSAGILLSNNASSNASTMPTFAARAENIRAARYTQFNVQGNHLNQAGLVAVHLVGAGGRTEADLITGIRIVATSGTLGNGADRITLALGA